MGGKKNGGYNVQRKKKGGNYVQRGEEEEKAGKVWTKEGKRIDQTITLLLSSYLDVGNKHRIISH